MRVRWKHFRTCRVLYYTDPTSPNEIRAMKQGNFRVYNSLYLLGMTLDLCSDDTQQFLAFLRSTFEPEYKSKETYKPTLKDKIYHKLMGGK